MHMLSVNVIAGLFITYACTRISGETAIPENTTSEFDFTSIASTGPDISTMTIPSTNTIPENSTLEIDFTSIDLTDPDISTMTIPSPNTILENTTSEIDFTSIVSTDPAISTMTIPSTTMILETTTTEINFTSIPSTDPLFSTTTITSTTSIPETTSQIAFTSISSAYPLLSTTAIPSTTISSACQPPCNNRSICRESDAVCVCNNPFHKGLECSEPATTLSPNFGPFAGGTRVTLTGAGVIALVSGIIIGENSCTYLFREETTTYYSVDCVTEALDTFDNLTEISMPVYAVVNGSEIIDTFLKFTYKPNPKLISLDPLNTIVSGGITITVSGFNLDSVAYPSLVYSLTDGNMSIPLESQPCALNTSTTIFCETPDVNDTLMSLMNATDSSASGSLSSYTVKMGANLDGFDDYNDFSESLPDYAFLSINNNPIVFPFDPISKTHMPEKEEFVFINGMDLMSIKLQEYFVYFGNSYCQVSFVYTNAILCRPPKTLPGPLNENDTKLQAGRILSVDAGRNLHYIVGFLDYPQDESTISVDEPSVLIIAISASAAGSFVLLVLLVIICRLRKKKKVPTATLR